MLKDTDYIKKTWTLIDSERTRMCTELSGLDTVKIYPAYANFVLVRILKEGLTSFDVFEKAIHQNLMIRDCSSFESLNGEYVRFCIMNQRIMTGCWMYSVHYNQCREPATGRFFRMHGNTNTCLRPGIIPEMIQVTDRCFSYFPILFF